MRLNQVRLFCIFDLPTETAKDKKAYRKFRKCLIKNGFEMLQYSVYVRSLPNKSLLEKYKSIIKTYIPNKGSVKVFYVTEAQYQNMETLVGEESKQDSVVGVNRVVVI